MPVLPHSVSHLSALGLLHGRIVRQWGPGQKTCRRPHHLSYAGARQTLWWFCLFCFVVLGIFVVVYLRLFFLFVYFLVILCLFWLYGVSVVILFLFRVICVSLMAFCFSLWSFSVSFKACYVSLWLFCVSLMEFHYSLWLIFCLFNGILCLFMVVLCLFGGILCLFSCFCVFLMVF